MVGSGWLPPLCESRTGAAHQRRGAPCQDASGLWCFEDGSGEPLQVLVVSDGHGGSRYDRSAVGSRLACRVALEEMQRELSRIRLNQRPDLQAWQRWLAETLPAKLLTRWRQEVLGHGGAHPRADGAPPSALAYGATLGVLLLTPRWWGCTGLGDWDLVRIDHDGSGTLLSEEADQPGGGEATFSLCMEGAERHFAARSALVPLSAEQPPFQLLLSSDGIRKSCGSDADFLTLARHLSGLQASDSEAAPSALAQALDHISGQGSGDDVSVAIGRWGQLGTALPPQRARRQRGRQSSAAQIVQPGQGLGATEPGGADAGGQRLAGAPGAAGTEPSLAAVGPATRAQPWDSPWLVGGLAGAALAVAAAAAVLPGWGPFARRQHAPDQGNRALAAVLRQQAGALCRAQPPGAGPGEAPAGAAGSKAARTASAGSALSGAASRAASPSPPGAAADRGGKASPSLNASLLGSITDTLNQRRRSFRDLQQGTISRDAFLARPEQDPTGTLIAWSALVSSAGRPAVLPALELCPELREALIRQWQRAQIEAAAAATTPMPPPDSANR